MFVCKKEPYLLFVGTYRLRRVQPRTLCYTSFSLTDKFRFRVTVLLPHQQGFAKCTQNNHHAVSQTAPTNTLRETLEEFNSFTNSSLFCRSVCCCPPALYLSASSCTTNLNTRVCVCVRRLAKLQFALQNFVFVRTSRVHAAKLPTKLY